MEIDEIKQLIKEIIKSELYYNLDYSNSEIYDEELLGDKIRFQARELLELFFRIEERFKVILSEEEIIKGKFNTINNISELVLKSLSEQFV